MAGLLAYGCCAIRIKGFLFPGYCGFCNKPLGLFMMVGIDSQKKDTSFADEQLRIQSRGKLNAIW
jgi:hypothetical protein